MYSEKLKSAKVDCDQDGRVAIGSSLDATQERLREIVLGFCTKDDLHGVPQTEALNLFDEYCIENGYPLFKRKAVGHMFREVFGVTSYLARIDGKVTGIYV